MSPMAKMPGVAGLELLGVGRDQVLVQVQAPVGDRPELHRQAEERQHVVARRGRRSRRSPCARRAPKAARPRP